MDKKQLIALAILDNMRTRASNTPETKSILTRMVKFVGIKLADPELFVSRFVHAANQKSSRQNAVQHGIAGADFEKAYDTYNYRIEEYIDDNEVYLDNPDEVAKLINNLLGVDVEWTHDSQGGETDGDQDKPKDEPKAGEATQDQLDEIRASRAKSAAGALQGDANGESGGDGGEGGDDRPVMHSELPPILKAEADKMEAKLKKVLQVSVDGDMKLADAIGHLTGEVSELEVRLNKMAEGMRTEMGDQLDEFKTKLQEQATTKQPMVIMARGRRVELDADEVEQYHHVASHVFTGIAAGVNIALIGPAGCGKTKLCAQIAEKLGLTFRFTGALDSPYKLTGFRTADGSVVRTPFREAYEHGGLFLLDEIDGSDPGVLLTLNAALANGVMDFPDAIVTQHEDFYAVAAANTFWNGRDREYVGRNQLDGSTVDRFMFIEMGYDLALESRIAPVKSWARVVQAYRKGAEVSKTRHIISQRATIDGGKLLLAGMTVENVLKFVLFKGLTDSVQAKLEETATREAGGRLAGLLKSVAEEVKSLTREVPEAPAMAAE